MRAGDRVKVTARGVFNGYTGEVVRVTHRHRRSRRRASIVYWVVMDDHDWQRAVGGDWGFAEKELELLTTVVL